MTVEEWYKPVPKNVRFKPCICGYNRRRIMFYYGQLSLVCNNCGLMSPYATSHEQAKLNWNRIVEDTNSEKHYYPIEEPYRFIPPQEKQAS